MYKEKREENPAVSPEVPDVQEKSAKETKEEHPVRQGKISSVMSQRHPKKKMF